MLVLEAQLGGAVAGLFVRRFGGALAAGFATRFPAVLFRGAARLGGGAASQIIGEAAGMGTDLALALEGEDGGHRPVEEIAIVADNQDGAVIFGDHFLKQVERFHVQIVGRLVQHQEIMRLGKQLCQQQPVLLAAGQGGDLLRHLVVVEQEVAQIGGDMPRGAGDLDHVAAAVGQHRPGR